MADIDYIKKYAKIKLNIWKRLPVEAQKTISVFGLDLNGAKEYVAKTFGFNSWNDLIVSPVDYKRFIKILLKHNYVNNNGFFSRKSATNWSEYEWAQYVDVNLSCFATKHQYSVILRVAKVIKDMLKPISSINYKMDAEQLYNMMDKENLCRYIPFGNIAIGHFIFAMLLAGFRIVKSDTERKIWFNVSQKSINNIR